MSFYCTPIAPYGGRLHCPDQEAHIHPFKSPQYCETLWKYKHVLNFQVLERSNTSANKIPFNLPSLQSYADDNAQKHCSTSLSQLLSLYILQVIEEEYSSGKVQICCNCYTIHVWPLPISFIMLLFSPVSLQARELVNWSWVKCRT